MKLYSSKPSPFGRKVKITAAICGLTPEITVIPLDTNDPNSAEQNPNPLNKIPVLETEAGSVIADSRVICEYLIDRSGRTDLLPADQRIQILTGQALADGCIEAALLMVYERRFRDESQINTDWLNRLNQKVLGALDWAIDHLEPVEQAPTLDQITWAVALGYLDFRFSGEWRTRYSGLALWLTQFQQMVPAYRATDPMHPSAASPATPSP